MAEAAATANGPLRKDVDISIRWARKKAGRLQPSSHLSPTEPKMQSQRSRGLRISWMRRT